MKPGEFVKTYLQHARECEQKTRISAIFTLAQAAIESAWGKCAPGFNFFGIKDSDGRNGNEQLLETTEYSQRSDLKFPVIISVNPVMIGEKKYFQYRVKDYFRKYENAGESFDDHAAFFYRNPRYRNFIGVANDPIQAAIQVTKAGYATDPLYYEKLTKVIGMIQKIIKDEKL